MVEFYKELNAVHNQIPRGGVCSLTGYFNTQVGNDNGIQKGVTGKHSLYAKENDNGESLLEFCCLDEYVLVGTLFTHKDIHKGTWVSSAGKSVNQIDHLCVNRKLITSMQDVRNYKGADINTTHYLIKRKRKLKQYKQNHKLKIKKPD